MMYGDKTFCQWGKECTAECNKRLTPEVEAAAIESGLPLALFVAPPVCHTSWKDRQDLEELDEI